MLQGNEGDDMKHESSIIDDIVEEMRMVYQNLSLIDLLTEENILAVYIFKRGAGPIRNRLREILRAQIEENLR